MKVNGTEEELQSSCTLEAYLQSKGFDITRVAVELNSVVVPRDAFATTLLEKDAILEIVHFVGGG